MSVDSHPHGDFSGEWWERHYQEHGTGPAEPSPQVVAELTGVPGGTALDAGCGAGADARWLAARGWKVTAVDVSATVVAAARSSEQAERVTWMAADLTTWEPPERYDLVLSQYVHPAVPFTDFVRRLATFVGPRGTLLVAGHDHTHEDPDVLEGSAIQLEAITSGLDPADWRIDVAEAREVAVSGQHPRHDVVVVARRTS
jgi:2-polyprenyl-3-methyl-5-hydroxy-6-metoxy-1,4-benzoquinol methylase